MTGRESGSATHEDQTLGADSLSSQSIEANCPKSDGDVALAAHAAIVSRLDVGGLRSAALAAAVHDFNQPLSAIQNYNQSAKIIAGRLPVGTPNAALLVELCELIHGQIQRVSELARALRQIAREGLVARSPIDLHSVLHAVVGMNEKQFRRMQIPVRLELNASAAIVHGDEQLLKWLLLDALRRECELQSMVPEPCRCLRVATWNEERRIRVEFERCGRFESTEDLESGAERFFPTQPSADCELCAPLCAAIITSHGGGRPEGGDGAPFRVWLPVDAADGGKGQEQEVC